MLRIENVLQVEYSPIYDSGSSLGREIDENRIGDFLQNPDKIIKYIKKGESEIRWQNEKVNHFELLSKIITEYKSEMQEIFRMVEEKFDSEAIKQLIYTIDLSLNDNFTESKLTSQRKELILQFINQRFTNLKQIISNA